MDDNTTYYKDPAKRIYELLEDAMGDKYQYFLGSPRMIGQGAYPCIIVQSTAGNNTVTGAPTGHDTVSSQISIYIYHLEQDQAASTGTTDTVMRNIFNEVEGRDPLTGFYLPATILYTLRTNLTLQGCVIDHDIDINYDVVPEGDVATIAGIVTVVTRERVAVPNRV